MIRNRGNAEHYVWGGRCDGWRLLDRADLGVTEERIPPGHGEVRHFHSQTRQLFFVLSGRLEIEVEGVLHRLGKNDSLEVQARRIHSVRNDADTDVSFLVISAPNSRGDREDVDDPARPAQAVPPIDE